jgi:hypothetical protein
MSRRSARSINSASDRHAGTRPITKIGTAAAAATNPMPNHRPKCPLVADHTCARIVSSIIKNPHSDAGDLDQRPEASSHVCK